MGSHTPGDPVEHVEDFIVAPRRAVVVEEPPAPEEEPRPQRAPEPPPEKNAVVRAARWVFELFIIVLGALVISTLVRTFVAQPFVIPTGSMENTIIPQDRVLVAKFGGFQRGDVVVFEDPGIWLPEVPKDVGPVQQALEFVGLLPNSGTEHLIKRVIGMPGDRVKCCTDDGNIEVNGHALDERAYIYSEGGVQVAPATVPFEVIVPKDHIFVMGDHRNASADSRCRLTMQNQGKPQGSAAFVPVDKVVGSAVSIIAPLDRASLFNVPEIFAAVPEPSEPAPDQPKIIHAEPGC